MVAKKYGTDHHEIVVRPDSIGIIRKFARHFGEPFADSSAIPTFIVSEFAARHVKVALSGDGGDELFGGYTSLRQVQKLAAFDRVPQSLRLLMSWASSAHALLGVRQELSAHARPAQRRWTATLRSTTRPTTCAPSCCGRTGCCPPKAASWRARCPIACCPTTPTSLSQVMYFEATANLTGDMLVKVDRMSMANSLEVRCPLLDHELAELAATIPHAWKVATARASAFCSTPSATVCRPELLNRPKTGFGVPLVDWFRSSLRELLWDTVTADRFLARDIVAPEFLRAMLEEHDAGRRDNSQWLFTPARAGAVVRGNRTGASG